MVRSLGNPVFKDLGDLLAAGESYALGNIQPVAFHKQRDKSRLFVVVTETVNLVNISRLKHTHTHTKLASLCG